MNYRMKEGAATTWRRSHHIVINNPIGGPASFAFQEQDVVDLNGKVMVTPGDYSAVGGQFDPAAEFPLISPIDGKPFGKSMTQQELYVALHSLYMHLAVKRDTPPVIKPVEPTPEEPVREDPVSDGDAVRQEG
jgi:hypothetical protein